MDAWTTVCVRISAVYGYYRFELLINAAKVKSPGASDDDARENLEFHIILLQVSRLIILLLGYMVIH